MAKSATGLAAAERLYVQKLRARRSELSAEVGELDAKLRAVGASATSASAASAPRSPTKHFMT